MPKITKAKKKKLRKEQQTISEDLNGSFILYSLFIVTAIGFYLRISNVGEISLWVDEYVHVLRAKNLVEGNGPLFTNDNNGILYTIFILPFFYLFETSSFWSRIPSVLFGTGAIVLVYYLGKNLFNRSVGIISSVVLSFSLYNVYWSRLSRNYVIFLFFYLLVLLCFIKGFERREKLESKKILERVGISPKYLGLLSIFFVLSLLSHQLAFLFVFGVLVYFIGGQILMFIDNRKNAFQSKYLVLSIVSLVALVIIFSPFTAPLVEKILGYFLPKKIVTWVIPDWSQLMVYYENSPFKTFTIYFDVLKIDYPFLFWFGLVGLPASFLISKKSGVFLFSMFVVPFVLMSFVFKDPSLPRYVIFIYPLFLVSLAVSLFIIFNWIYLKMVSRKGTVKFTIYTCILPVVFVLFFVQTKELGSLAKAELKQGFIVDKRLSNWSFTNWKFPSQYVRANIKEGDIIMSTVPNATKYYVTVDSCILFRQRYYDTREKRYKNYKPNQCANVCANSYEDLRDILTSYERGWLLADYYFYNVMTDPRARTLVCKYMDYHPIASKDGSVLVFSWNQKNPKPILNQSMLYVLGKSKVKTATDEMGVNLNSEVSKMRNLKLHAYARSLSKNEMWVLVNNKYKIAFPSTKEQTRIEKVSISLKPEYLKEGKNTFRFFYNQSIKYDAVKGFSLHHFVINARN